MLSKTDKDIKINIKEVYRYLGYGKTIPSEDMREMIDVCTQEVIECSELRFIAERFPVTESTAEGELSIGDLKIVSKALSKNLMGCKEAYLMGATTGIGIDRLIARAAVMDVTRAAIYQAIGAAYIEDYCDYVNEEINIIACKENLETMPRFSPGYGDLSLEYQKDISQILNLSKNVGISLTESRIMSPSKSVTAIIGLKEAGSSKPSRLSRGSVKKCGLCDMVDCQYRER